MENEFTIGQVFSKSFDIFTRNIVFMLIVSFLVSVPDALMKASPQSGVWIFFSFLAVFVMAFLAQGIVVFGVFQHLTGQQAVFSQSLNVALARFFPLLLVSIASSFLAGIGFMLLVIPGVIVMLALWVAVPVTIVEKGGVGFALSRSNTLTQGYRGRIFAVVFLLGILNWVLMGLEFFITSSLMPTGPSAGGLSAILISLPLSTILSGMATALNSVVVTVGYYTLRHEVEGVAVEDLASVFE
jgi:hypothetical protein|nr:hypothetical protein [Candidatus Krumholzibacteria bacterium]